MNGLYLSQISPKFSRDSTEIRPTFMSSNSNELKRLRANATTLCRGENLSESLQISRLVSSQANKKQMSKKATKLRNSLSKSATNEDELDVISPLSDDSSLPLTPSPPDTLTKSEILKQVSLATLLNRSDVAEYCPVMESQHTRSLMRAISSPKFCRNNRKYVNNELTSRFNDDGKVRRKKAERQLLHGFDCRCCVDYYEALRLNQEEHCKRIDQVVKIYLT